MKFKIRTDKDKSIVADYIASLPQGKVFTAEIKVHRERRSINQNSLYWLWLACLQDETGAYKDDLHECFKSKFLPHTTKEVLGEDIRVVQSTSSLDSKEMTSYLERIKIFAQTELGCVLPLPEDLGWEQFYEQYKRYI